VGGERARRFYESQGSEDVADGHDDSLDIAEATYARALRD
jgi:hypothetical protein